MSGQAPIRAASDVYFFIATQDGLVRLLHDLSSCPVVAVDTESNSFYAYYERICLIQLSTPDADYIVDPLAGLDLSPLGERFADPLIQKVFHAAEQDVAGLKRDFGFGFANLFDTMWAARILGWARIGLADILREIFDVHTDKRYQRYDWGKRPLEPTALAYARRDTHYLLALRELQVRALEEMKRNEEAAEVFARLTQTPPACVPFGPEAFWRVKGVHDLNGRERAVLWELYLWRDRMARAQNQPPFRVMNDQTLGILARTRPRTLGDLSRIPGLTRATIRQYGRALLAAVARGEAGPIPQPPPPARGRGSRPQPLPGPSRLATSGSSPPKGRSRCRSPQRRAMGAGGAQSHHFCRPGGHSGAWPLEAQDVWRDDPECAQD